ncbi:Cobalamin biosynthesis protein CobW [Staphylococcus argensis]
MYPILNGCVCCDSSTDLIDRLMELTKDQSLTHIIIEATGIAQPLDIYSACLFPDLTDRLAVPTIIGVADAQGLLTTDEYSQDMSRLMSDQLAASHFIIINKTDLVEDDHLKHIDHLLSYSNTFAPRVYTSYGQVDLAQIEPVEHPEGTANESYKKSHLGINSLVYTFTGPVHRQLFYQFILKLPSNVLRLKGYMRFRDMPETTYFFQYASGMPSYEIVEREASLTLVLIGEELDINRLRNQLDMLQFT